eukprot:m.60712 g.60712  ORF g.60712 m.60712 type:complete len:228 (-) comp19213_c0_seq1:201-884(-)
MLGGGWRCVALALALWAALAALALAQENDVQLFFNSDFSPHGEDLLLFQDTVALSIASSLNVAKNQIQGLRVTVGPGITVRFAKGTLDLKPLQQAVDRGTFHTVFKNSDGVARVLRAAPTSFAIVAAGSDGTSNIATVPNTQESTSGVPTATLVGVIVGCTLFVVLFLLVLYYVRFSPRSYSKTKKSKTKEKPKWDDPDGQFSPFSYHNPVATLQSRSSITVDSTQF